MMKFAYTRNSLYKQLLTKKKAINKTIYLHVFIYSFGIIIL